MMYQRSIGKHFFISHSSRDKNTARKLRKDLTAAGISTWLDDDITPGEDWDSAIETAITHSLAVLYLVSPASHTSRMVAAELDVAENYERDIIPLWIGGEEWEDVVIMGYGRKHYRDMRGNRYNEQLTMLQDQLLRRQRGETPALFPEDVEEEANKASVPQKGRPGALQNSGNVAILGREVATGEKRPTSGTN